MLAHRAGAGLIQAQAPHRSRGRFIAATGLSFIFTYLYNHSMHLHLLKASGRLLPFEADLTLAFNEVVQKVIGKIALPEVDVVMADNPNNVIAETGVGGFAINANLIYVNINPESSYFRENTLKEVVSTLTHELHHCARIHSIGYGKTLLEAMVSEGLADHFDIELNKHTPNPWSVNLAPTELAEMYKKASTEFANNSYDHSSWFFGSEEKDIPRWTGYSLGFEIVKKHMEKSSKSAAELVSTRAEPFI